MYTAKLKKKQENEAPDGPQHRPTAYATLAAISKLRWIDFNLNILLFDFLWRSTCYLLGLRSLKVVITTFHSEVMANFLPQRYAVCDLDL